MSITGISVSRLQGRHHYNRVNPVVAAAYAANDVQPVETYRVKREEYARLVAERFFTKVFVGYCDAPGLVRKYKHLQTYTLYPMWELEWSVRMPGLNHNRGWFLYALAADSFFNDGNNHYAWLGNNYKHYLARLAEVEGEVGLLADGELRRLVDVHV